MGGSSYMLRRGHTHLTNRSEDVDGKDEGTVTRIIWYALPVGVLGSIGDRFQSMTSGQYGLLFLYCMGFSPFTPCCYPGTPQESIIRFLFQGLISMDWCLIALL
jgi:hypothetical protein